MIFHQRNIAGTKGAQTFYSVFSQQRVSGAFVFIKYCVNVVLKADALITLKADDAITLKDDPSIDLKADPKVTLDCE